MSLRLIAQDLYRLQQKVDRLEKTLEICPPRQKEERERQLAQAVAERDQLKRILNGRLNR